MMSFKVKVDDYERFTKLRKENGLLAHQLLTELLNVYVEKQEKESDKQ